MSQNNIEICGQSFDLDREHFGFEWPFRKIEDMSELVKLSQFPNLKSASFGSTNLNDSGLELVCGQSSIENLNLQDTKVSNSGILFLSQLKRLQYLRLKENSQLDNSCVQHLNKLQYLIDLQLHETNISRNGLKNLNIQTLRNLLINEVDKATLIQLSQQLPDCSILVKGKVELLNGKILWEK